AFSETKVTFNVTPVNDAPRWGSPYGLDISTLRVHFDEPYAFDLSPYISDIDSPLDELRMISSSPYVRSAAGLPFTALIEFPLSFNGSTFDVTLFFVDGSTV